MERADQIRIVNEMANSLQQEMLKVLESGRVPEKWDGFELRQWFADLAKDRYSIPLKKWPRRGRKQEYTRVALVDRLV